MKKQIQSFLLILVCLLAPASYAQDPAVVKVYRELGEIQERTSVTFSPKKRQYTDVSTVVIKGNTTVRVWHVFPEVMRNNKLWKMWLTIHASGQQDKDVNKRYRVYPERMYFSDDELTYMSTINMLKQQPNSESMVVHYIFTIIYKGKKEVSIAWPLDLTVESVKDKPTTVINGIKNGVVYHDGKLNTLSRHSDGEPGFTRETLQEMMGK